MKRTIWKGLTPIFALLLAALLGCTSLLWQYAGMVDGILDVKKEAVTVGGEVVYASRYGEINETNKAAMLSDLRAYLVSASEEGSVLLKNNGVLPLQSDVKKVTLLGKASVDPVYRYTAGGSTFSANGVTLKGALESAGFEVNGKVFSAYEANTVVRDKVSGFIGEADADFFTNDIIASFQEYNDLAIVVFSRYGGEGTDLKKVDADGVSQLSLHESEKAVLRQARAHFSRVILLVNSGNPMELGWMDSEEYGVDACLWIGTPGEYGFEGVVNLLTGKANPSGGLVDTYATDSLSAAATQNFGDYTFANANDYGLKSAGIHDVTNKYLIESEGIYVGYRYYETRYEDSILGQGNADSTKGVFASSGNWNYAEEVAFPFGFGLSYTDFDRKISAHSENGPEGEEFSIDVTVTNIGKVAGKTPVQIYVQTPYTDYDRENLVEKSAVQLVGFAKTGIIEPGQSETVTVKVDKYLLASYDMKAHDGKGGYTLEAGDYIFATGNGVHEALNNILAAKGATGLYDHNGEAVNGDTKATFTWTLDKLDDTTYQTANGTAVENRLQDADINYWKPGTVTYLTRNDWNTFPEEVSTLEATKEMADVLNADGTGEGSYETYSTADIRTSAKSYTQGAAATIQLAEMKGVDLDDPKWEQFLDQMTIAQLAAMTSDMTGIKPVKDIGFPGFTENDGPDGGGSVLYVGEIVSASSFSPEMLMARGDFFAEEALFDGRTGLWGPGADIHRTPFGGRNFEYYSEDSNMSYLCAMYQCSSMHNKGFLASIKHFCGNDQEMNRYGVCTFTTEQAWRQGPLRGFEGAFTKAGNLYTMTSYSRYGLQLTCESDIVNNQILRGEWGFKGMTITDAGSGSPLDSIAGGTDVFCMNDNSKVLAQWISKNDDGTMLGYLRNANKHIFYALLNSNLANILTTEMTIDDGMSWWQYVVIGADVLFGVLTFAGAALYTVNLLKKRKEA